MRHTRIGALVPTLALVLALAAGAWAECAPYISTGINDRPDTGTLIGTETRTEVVSEELDVSSSSSVGITSTKWGGSFRRTTYKQTSRTYEVGTYQMSDGSRLKVDCSDYTLA